MSETAGTGFSWQKLALPVVMAALAYWLLRDFPAEQRHVGTIFALTVGLWMSEVMPLGITALVSSALLILAGGLNEKKVFAAYGDTTIPLFIGSFILAKGMEVTGLGERFAHLILAQKWATRSASALLLSVGAIACLLSLFISNTATTAMLLPIGLSLLAAIGSPDQTRLYAIGLMMMLTWGSSIAVGVPVGTPPNLIGIDMLAKATGERIGFLQWMTFGMPITLAMLVACWAVLRWRYGRGAPATAPVAPVSRACLAEMGRMSEGQRNTLLAFVVAIILWMLPDSLLAIMGPENEFAKQFAARVPASVAALIGASLLFLLPGRQEDSRMNWRTAASIDWGTILLFAGGIALGQAMFESGLAKSLGEMAAEASGARTVWGITALVTAAAILLSELASNTAAATTLVPVAIGLAEGAGVSPVAPALGVALGASMGFMLPVSTAPNAIVYSSGLVPAREMLKSGILIDIIGFIVVMAGLMLILPAMGLA